MNDEEKRIHEIVLNIYDTAIDPTSWPHVLDSVSEYVGAVGALIIDVTGTNRHKELRATHFTSNYNTDIANKYLTDFCDEEWEDQKIFSKLSVKADEIELVSDEILASSREELEKRRNVEFMRSIGLKYRAGALLNKDIILNNRFAFQFNKEQGPLNAKHIKKSGYLLPHLAKALNVGRPTANLSSKYSFVLDGLDQLKSGVCIVDERRQIVVKNTEFDRQLEEYSVFHITNDGRLEFNNRSTMKSAVEMFSSLGFHGRFGARPRKEAINSASPQQQHDLCIEIIPLNNTTSIDRQITDGSIIFSLDTSQHSDIDIDKISVAYTFTNSEIQVFQHLAEGLTNPQIAERCEKSVETVNSQVKSILSKTMTANRVQLIRMATQTGNIK